jgi:hypothetical protein
MINQPTGLPNRAKDAAAVLGPVRRLDRFDHDFLSFGHFLRDSFHERLQQRPVLSVLASAINSFNASGVNLSHSIRDE